MQVPAPGMGGSLGLNQVTPHPIPPPNSGSGMIPGPVIGSDSVSAILRELSQSNLARLMEIMESPLKGISDSQAVELLRASAEAIAAHNGAQALELVRELATRDPARWDQLRSAPELAAIRPEVERLLMQLTAAARVHAESRLADATRRFAEGSLKNTADIMKPETAVLLAGNLIEAGSIANYIRSSALSMAIVEPAVWFPPTDAPRPASRLGGATKNSKKKRRILIRTAVGIAAVALCWWLRRDFLPTLCFVGACAFFVSVLFRGALRRKY